MEILIKKFLFRKKSLFLYESSEKKSSFLQDVIWILAVYASFNPSFIDKGAVCTAPERKFLRT